ncbi:hypothetical protein BJ912DRAFT_606584 [Pholiota molesta]|nr:hypothetical protein BJ912DRAFT_606584 [Pholiota molesta]
MVGQCSHCRTPYVDSCWRPDLLLAPKHVHPNPAVLLTSCRASRGDQGFAGASISIKFLPEPPDESTHLRAEGAPSRANPWPRSTFCQFCEWILLCVSAACNAMYISFPSPSTNSQCKKKNIICCLILDIHMAFEFTIKTKITNTQSKGYACKNRRMSNRTKVHDQESRMRMYGVYVGWSPDPRERNAQYVYACCADKLSKTGRGHAGQGIQKHDRESDT